MVHSQTSKLMSPSLVHADASNFANGVTKEEAYEQVLLQAEGLFDGQRNWVWYANPQTTQPAHTSLLWHAYHSLPAPSASVNWAGFYVLDPLSTPAKPSLILGPFMGKVACQTIPFGRGVCGAAAATRETQLVPDVDAFPGHIACDGDSKSEVVVPVVAEGGKLVAIIDVDCAVTQGFDEVDRVWLEKLAALLAKSCDW
ncbi:free methionine-R-sulfoxide reductase [Colletotrichum spaethianum]|uniref:Free methionine-R-sulfoxide reductase n=1 Tax=Colletotrichum spaethianum TaxID=700344 RepID=A0AA37LB32_9PEZI|nr:free methionine-R-sulfoxide reductase [Colletotrichum spaethianum]GKT45103.1 free methionine-R-sulfoxide reductase [Colletotrichum spaethianum]